MRKIKTLLRRIKGMSFKRMFMHVNQIHEESGRAKLFIVIDMFWSFARYGVGYLDYKVFGFNYVRGKEKRKTFFTMNDNLFLVRNVNNKEYDYKFSDKIAFNETFGDYLGREWLDLNKASVEDFEKFLSDKKTVFVKVVDSCGGNGVEKVEINEKTDIPALYNELLEKKQTLVEECLVQHPKMNELSPSSINTIRITSVLKGEQVYIMYALVRMSNGESSVDNISSGGMYCPVDENGMIFAPSFCDKTGLCYKEHPFTKTKFEGFVIPFYKEAEELVKKAALEVPQIRYVGWDVAICKDGPVLIEGNTIPGYDMCQNHYHLRGDVGILPRFQKIFGEDFSDLG
ncbi:MAG: hypothetical protein K5917_03445 [Clostridiales bacterium]|nr:hypothetical protein [Clostridiales bacterium]